MISILYILLICYIPIIDIFLPKTHFGGGIPDLDAVRILSYLLVLSFIIITALKKEIDLFNKWSINLTFFSVIVLLSLAWSKEPFNAQTLAAIFDSVFIPLFIAVIALNIFKEEKNVDRFIKHICWSGFILSMISLYKMIIRPDAGHAEDMVFRSAGFGHLGNPNGLAIFLVLTVPCILHAIREKTIKSIIGWIILFSVAGGVICTVSRKGMITMLISMFLYFLLTTQFKKLSVLIICASIAIGFLAGNQNISKRFEKQELEHQIQGKARMALAGLKMFASSPLIGKGYRGYHNNWKKYFPTSRNQKYSAHNIYITAIANYGALGFIPFMFIFLYPLFISVKILRGFKGIEIPVHLRKMSVICISSVIPFMMSAYFAGGLFYSAVKMTLFYAVVSFVLAAYAGLKLQE